MLPVFWAVVELKLIPAWVDGGDWVFWVVLEAVEQKLWMRTVLVAILAAVELLLNPDQ